MQEVENMVFVDEPAPAILLDDNGEIQGLGEVKEVVEAIELPEEEK